jgi:dihydroflavonol-4-reductase
LSGRVLVTGGTGFVGAHVVRAHLAAGWVVRCAVRASSPGMALDGLDVERVELPLDDPAALSRALSDVDAVQHVAGIFDPTPGGDARMRAVHVEATRALCEAALAQASPPRLVLCSSSITVGWGSAADPADEDSPVPDPDRVYGRGNALRTYYDSKLEAEALVRSYVEQGLHAVTVNPDYVIGPWDRKPTSGAIILAMARRWVPIHPRGGKSFIDAADCGLGHVRALERGRPGARYLLGMHNLSYRDFMGRVARVVGRPPPVLPMPRTLTGVVGQVGRVLNRLPTERFAGLQPQVLASMQSERYRSGARAREELGLPDTPIEASIQSAYAWFRDHGYC